MPNIYATLNAWRILIFGVALFSTTFGCQKEIQEIRIGVIAPLSGEMAPDYGVPTVEGAKIAVKKVNDAGGLDVKGHKFKVVLIIEDNQDRAEVAVAAAKKLINQENVVAIVGLPLSRNAIPVANVAEGARVPMISTKSTNPQTTAGKKYVFRAIFIDPFQGQVLAHFARKDLNANMAGVLYDVASAYNRGLAEAFRKTFKDMGGRVVAFETYTTDRNKDFSHQLARIHKSGAQVLFLPNYPAEILLQAQQARRLGIMATLLGGDTWGEAWKSSLFAEHVTLENAFFSEVWHADVANEKACAFIDSYRQPHDRDPNANVPLAFDSLGMIFKAIQMQGKVDTDAIREGLYGMGPYQGITGTMEYKQTGDPVRSAVILKIQGDKTILHTQVDP